MNEQSIVAPPRSVDPGQSDEAVLRATGKSWDEWLSVLDAWGATGRTHKEIAQYVYDTFRLEGWWAQGVTVGYERLRGMRAVHQTADGFNANASKIFAVSVDRLFRAFVDEAERDQWLEPETLRLRTAQSGRSARFDFGDGITRVEVYFTAKGPDKSSAAIQHAKLTSAGQVEEYRGFWKERLSRLATCTLLPPID